MIDTKKLHELTKKGVITIESGIRVIDASKLDGQTPRRLPPAPVKLQKVRGDATRQKPYVANPSPSPEPESTGRKTLLPEDLRKRETLNERFTKEFEMVEGEVPHGIGLDVGTSFLVAGRFDKQGHINFAKIRDCFLHIPYKTPINQRMIKKGLDDRHVPYIEQPDGYYVLGEDAFTMANERHQNTRRPMSRGVLSPKEKAAFPILKELINLILIKPRIENEKVVFSVPAKPIDAKFDQLFHQDMIKSFIASKGFEPHPMNEAEALAYSELLEDGLTGIAISCLIPGTKIYANYDIKNIEDICVGDTVITHKGRPQKVLDVITKNFKGISTKIMIQGYSDNVDDYQFVDNHELYIFRKGNWQWVGCEDVFPGDLVGEPIVNQDIQQNKHTMTICKKITSSPKTIKTSYRVSQDLQRLMGYFLGDGSVGKAEGCIQFDFHRSEKENILDVQEIFQKVFGKKSAEINKGNNVIRIKCYSRGLASWFHTHCYNDMGEKVFPWSLQRMSKGDCLNLLTGLLRSDGRITNDKLEFFNTSTNLIWLTKQLFSRVGIAASIGYREPRLGGKIGERQIIGKKIKWRVSSCGKLTTNSLLEMVSNLDCSNSIISEKLSIQSGFCCGIVQEVVKELYEGIVYDLKIDEDHSFSGPMLTIHNCGAGMMNIVVLSAGDPVVTFSTSRSGDWVDEQAAIATDMTMSLVQQEKEGDTLDLMNPDPHNQIHQAISVYYGNLLVYTLENIAHDLTNSPSLPKFKEPIPLVVGGGTSLPKGFIDKFKQALDVIDMPVQISQIRHARDPLHAVCNGLVLAASMN